MKKKHSLLLLTIGILLCGCGEEITPETPPIGNVLNISAVKNVLATSSTENFKTGAEIGVYMTTTAVGLKSTGNHLDNKKFTATALGFTATGVLFPEAVDHLDFYAYAPYASTGIASDRLLTFTIAKDQSTNPEQSDLLWAMQKASTSGIAGNLLFNHKLSRVKVTLKAGVGIALNSPTVTVSSLTSTVKLNMATGDLVTPEGSSIIKITPTSVSDSEKSVIIPPQTIPQGTEFITVVNNGTTYVHKLKANSVFESNKEYPVEITVNKTALEVVFTGSINGWGVGDSMSGSAI